MRASSGLERGSIFLSSFFVSLEFILSEVEVAMEKERRKRTKLTSTLLIC